MAWTEPSNQGPAANSPRAGNDFVLPGPESLAAELARVKAERDEALEEVRVLRHSESLEVLELQAALARKLREREEVRAELASARQDLELAEKETPTRVWCGGEVHKLMHAEYSAGAGWTCVTGCGRGYSGEAVAPTTGPATCEWCTA